MSVNQWLVRRVVLTALAALVFFSALSHGLTPLRSTQDFWWHLKAGKVIVEGGYTLPQKDAFSFTSADYDWHNHEYLTQVMMFWVYRWAEGRSFGAGVKAVILAKALALGAVFVFLFGLMAWRSGSAPVAAFVALLAINASRWTLYPRPPIVTYLFLVAFLFIIQRYVFGRMSKGWLFVLPLLMALWVNMHGGFILGLIVLGGFWLGEWMAAIYFRRRDLGNEESWRPRLERGKWLLVMLVLCLAATLLNPYGYKLYGIFTRVMGDAGLVGMIPELLPPDFRFTQSYLILSLLFVGGVVARGGLRRQWPHAGEALVAVFFLQQSLSHVRHLPIFALVAAPLITDSLAGLLSPKPNSDEAAMDNVNKPKSSLERKLGCRYVEMCFVFFALALATFYWLQQDTVYVRLPSPGGKSVTLTNREGTYYTRNMRWNNGSGMEAGAYPRLICDFILANRFHGRMFNAINDAGYLIWRLSPERHQTFTDARYDIFGSAFIYDEAIINNAQGPLKVVGGTQPGYRELLDEWEINFAVLGIGSKLIPALHQDDGWALIDPFQALEKKHGHLIFIRDTEGNRDLIQRCRMSQRRMRGR